MTQILDKQALISAIADRRAKVAELNAEIENLRVELAKHADWRVGDIVKDEPYATLHKITAVHLDDNGHSDTVAARRQRRKSGEWSDLTFTLWTDSLTLIKRPETK